MTYSSRQPFSLRLCRAAIVAWPSLLLAALLSSSAAADPTVIKFATLAPEGSSWMKVMNDFNTELKVKTGGKLKFKFYPGGVSGDEKDVVSKMRIGQLHAAGVTGRGLGDVAPELRVMDTPFLFRDTKEIDQVQAKFAKTFDGYLEKAGFVTLGSAEVGLVHIFTNVPVRSTDDLKKTKMWVWEGDPLAEALFKVLDVHPIPLSLPDVMTSLQTGLIDAVYGPPMGVVALQWFTKTKYVYAVPMASASGAILVSKKFVDGLPADTRAALLELGNKYTARITELSRTENKEALAALQKQGLTLTQPSSPDALERYEELGKKARRSLAGKLYPAELLDQVERTVQEARAGKSPLKGSPGSSSLGADNKKKPKDAKPQKG